MPGRDIAVAAVMFVFAVVVFRESWNMPVFSDQALTAPGLFPMITAAAMAGLALIVLIQRVPQALGWRHAPPAQGEEEELGSIPKMLLCALITGIAIALMRPAGFILAGMFATGGLMLAGLGRRPRLAEAALILGLALALPFGTHRLFTLVFLTPLP